MSKFSSEIVNKVVTTGPDGIKYDDTFWDDIKFPFTSARLYSPSSDIVYNFTDLGIDFKDSAIFDTDLVAMVCQIPHKWKIGTDIYPHIHWVQTQNAVPNWLIEYRVYDNGTAPGSWVEAIATTGVFTYTSGSLMQISAFPAIDMSGITGVSAIADFRFFRDTDNDSTLFTGLDAYTGTALVKEFDVHFEIDYPGSRDQYIK